MWHIDRLGLRLNADLAFCLVLPAALLALRPAPAWSAQLSLDEALRQVKVPPNWLEQVQTDYDTGEPWRKARLHIRKLLAKGGAHNKEAIKLTYDYLVERKVQEDVHERLGARALSSWPQDRRLWVQVVWDDGTLQDAADATWGDDVVVVQSALHEIG